MLYANGIMDRAISVRAVAMLLTLAGRQTCAQMPVCTPGAWSEPRMLVTASGQPVIVEAAAATPFRGGIALLGTPNVVWKSSRVFADSSSALSGNGLDWAGVVVGPDFTARPVGLPRGVTQMVAPRSVRAADGTLHVIWASSPDSVRRPRINETDLWYARFDGTTWSEPERILSAREIWWNSEWQAMTAVDGEPRISVAVNASLTSPSHTGVAYLRRSGTAWTVSWTSPYPGSAPFNTAVAADARGAVMLAFVGSVFRRGARNDLNGLFVTHSADSGATWDAPERVQDFGPHRGHALQALRQGQDTMHLLWLVDSQPANPGASIEHAVSTDRGASWRLAPPLGFAEPMGELSAVMLDGAIHGVLRNLRTRSLVHVTWASPAATALRTLPFEPAKTPHHLDSIGRDSVLLTWGVDRENSYPLFPRLAVPALLYSVMTTQCR